MKLVLASHNRHKLVELQTILGETIPNLELLTLDDVGLCDEIEENGSTFEENARIKAAAAAASGYIGIGDDSGLCVDALGGDPGIFSARYAGEHGDDAANNARLLSELSDKEDRGARFVCALACVFPDGSPDLCVRGEAEGVILREPMGDGGFGYDPLFYYPPLEKSFGALSPEEKNRVSHRNDALRKMAPLLLARMAEKQ